MKQPNDTSSPGHALTLPANGSAMSARNKSISERLQRLEIGAATTERHSGAPHLLATGDVVGHYRVLGRLGSGGMGYITRALDLKLEREVAIKLSIEPIASDQEAMLREARALAALNHPNVVTVYEVGVHEGCAYLVMELLRGESLRSRLDRTRPSMSEALSWACDVLRGLAAAHNARMVHLDVKPENVFLTKEGAVKLIDFGIARHKRTGVQEQTEVVGTIAYMAPEQLLGDPLDFRADLFAFGILLHELVTGRHPFMRKTLPATMQALVCGDFLKDGTVVDLQIDAIVRSCMELEPTLRPASAAHVLERLEAVTRARSPALQPGLVSYAETEQGNIAVRSIGASQGVDLLVVPGFLSRFDSWSHEPEGAAFLRALTETGRVILFDRAGFGSSDRIPGVSLPCLDDEVEHIDAVLENVGASHVLLLALDAGAPLASLYAALRPERVRGLVIHAGAASYTDADARAILAARVEGWGTEKNAALCAPSIAAEARVVSWLSSWERSTASPKTARAWTDTIGRTDTSTLLPFISCPTLILHRQDDRFWPARRSQDLADRIPNAKHVVLPGEDHLPFAGAADLAPLVVEHTRVCQAEDDSRYARALATWVVTDAPVDVLPTRLRPKLELERGSMRVIRVDRPGAAERAMRSVVTKTEPPTKAVLTCSSRATSPEAILAETEALFGNTNPGDVSMTSFAQGLVEGTSFRRLPDPSSDGEPRLVSESGRARGDSGVSAISVAQTPPAAMARKTRLATLSVMVGLVVLTALITVATRKTTNTSPEVIPAAPQTIVSPAVQAHTLLLESRPLGATVKEGDKVLGKAPLSVPLSPLATETRAFTLSLEGYAEYTFRQTPTTSDVHFIAGLEKREPEIAPSAAPSAVSITSVSKRAAPPPRVAPPIPIAPDPTHAPGELEIRRNR